jgi:membrane-bound metal-dependent hydrolase YbcI (DUF457 family)
MWPWGHLAVGYFSFVLLLIVFYRRSPTKYETILVVAGTQIPDLIDKTFAWIFPLLPSGRSFGHSLLTLLLILGVASVYLKYGSKNHDLCNKKILVAGFAVGYLSHIITDLPTAVLMGDFSKTSFVLWPLLPAPTYSAEPSFQAHFYSIDFSGKFWMQILIFAAVIIHMSKRLQAIRGQ